MNEELRKQVAGWIAGGATVSEVHKRLETVSGLRYTRLEVRMLVGDLEPSAAQTGSQTQGIQTVEVPQRSCAVGYLEQRLRKSSFERCIGSRMPVPLRWLLFIPAGLAAGVSVFAIVIVAWTLIAPMSGDGDVMGYGGMAAGMFGGMSSVLVGLLVAPRGVRIVAGTMGCACVALTVIVVFLLWGKLNTITRVCLLIGGGLYSFCAVVLAVVICRSENTG